MLFNSMAYVAFFPIVTIIYYILPQKVRYIWLLIASYYFYMSWEAKYGILLFFTTFVTYIAGMIIHRVSDKKRKKIVLSISIVINLALLVYFKYINFLLVNINGVLSKIGKNKGIDYLNVILPVGISFFIFQAIGYVIDVYRNDIEPERNILRYALFVSFFPQLVAGPIERSKNLLHQLKSPSPLTGSRLREGLVMILYGIWMKVLIADNLATITNPIYGDYISYNGVMIALATMLFAIQIYCDFAGYTNIAIGSAKILGIDLMKNFAAPYCSLSVTEFWRRWHISLTSWFKDYLYIPLGGNRKGKIRKHINTFIVFLISGLWHGASWNYVVWGGLNGLIIIIESFLKGKNKYLSKVDRLVKMLITFVLFNVTLLFFRAPSLMQGIRMIMYSLQNVGLWKLFNESIIVNSFGSEQLMWVMLLAIGILICIDCIEYKTGDSLSYLFQQKEIYRWILYLFMIFTLVVYGAYGDGYEQTKFIYFQF